MTACCLVGRGARHPSQALWYATGTNPDVSLPTAGDVETRSMRKPRPSTALLALWCLFGLSCSSSKQPCDPALANGQECPCVTECGFICNQAKEPRCVKSVPLAIRLPERLADGRVGVAYGPVEVKVDGGSGKIDVGVASGSEMPPGLRMVQGSIMGTPERDGRFQLTIEARDSSYGLVARKVCTLEVKPPGERAPTGDGGAGE